MRVLHVVPSYLPAVRYGGPIVSVHGLCRALAAHGHDVHVHTTNVDGPNNSNVPLGTPVDLDGVKVWYFSVPALRRLYWSPSMGRALEQQMSGFDIAHIHSVFLWPTWAAGRTARRCRVPYMMSPRGMLVRDLIRRKSRWVKTAWIRLIERENLRGAAVIHLTSPAERAALAGMGFSLDRTVVIPNGIAVTSDSGSGMSSRSDLVKFLGESKSFILFMGRVNWEKGLDRLIRALAYLPEAKMVIAGNDEEEYTPSLERLADEIRVRGRMFLAGAVQGGVKMELLRRATVLVLPSYSESFGNVVLEAMAEGCPVVVTPEVGAASVVQETGGGLVVSGDPEALAGGIRQLLEDPALRMGMGVHGRDAVRSRYTWDAVAQQMIAAYQHVIVMGAP